MSSRISRESWGEHEALRLASDAVELVVVPAIGGRVISLRDVRRRREWLLQGPPPSREQAADWARQDVVFSGPESFGWDECLPTVSACPDPLDPAAPPLRDHGDQWGRAAEAAVDEAGSIETTWREARWAYRFSRRLSFDDEQTLLAEYRLQSLAEVPLPILWSQHAVLALEAGAYLDLPAVREATCSGSLGIRLGERVDWPEATLPSGEALDLACVRTGAGWAAKLYAEPPDEIRAVAPNGDRLDLDWDRAVAPALGIWLSYGGWPVDGPLVEQVALEPTTSGHDDLESASADDRAMLVAPGEQVDWWVRLRLSS